MEFTQINTTMTKVWNWIKRHVKKLLVGVGIISVAIVTFGNIPPEIQVNGVTFENCQTIKESGFEICSDKHDYGGDSEVLNYLYVKNNTGKKTTAIINPLVKRSEMRILSAEKWVENVPYEYEEQYVVSTSNQTVETATGTYNKQINEYDTRIVQDTKDEWQDVQILGKPYNNTFKNNNKEYITTNSFKIQLEPEEKAYFKVKLKTHSIVRNEPEEYLWQVKSNHGEAILDPIIDSSQWSHYFSITATSTITGTHTDFPLYYNGVSAPADCTSNLKADGSDIRITTSTPSGGNVNALDHELVSATTTAGSWEVWFRDPSLAASDKYYVLCGNASATDTSTSSVWNSNYILVWHSNESSGSAQDSTSNGFSGTFNGTMPNQVAGKLGNAQDYNGSTDHVEWGDNSAFSTYPITISIWAETDDSTLKQNFVNKYEGGVPSNSEYFFEYNPSGAGVSLRITGTGQDVVQGSTVITDTNYHYNVGVIRSTGAKVYLDGSQDNSGNLTTGSDGTRPLQVGIRNGLDDFDGEMDEIRLYSGELSANWISTEYKNQNNPSAFWSVGTATSTGGAEEEEVRGNVNWW